MMIEISEFMDRLLCLLEENKVEEVKSTTLSSKLDPSKQLSKRLRCVEDNMRSVDAAIESISTSTVKDYYLLKRYAAQVNSLDADLQDISQGILTLDRDEDLMEQRAAIKKALFDLGINIERLIQDRPEGPQPGTFSSIKLPKSSVPLFDGNMLNWASFWEQYCAAIHSNSRLKKAEKLVYLKDAV